MVTGVNIFSLLLMILFNKLFVFLQNGLMDRGNTFLNSLSIAEEETVQTNDTGLSGSDYAVRCKELLRLVNQLVALGFVPIIHYSNINLLIGACFYYISAQADVDLPRVTVIGNQSAGKSSLVEAISGVREPSFITLYYILWQMP
jgi:hypothetical protein